MNAELDKTRGQLRECQELQGQLEELRALSKILRAQISGNPDPKEMQHVEQRMSILESSLLSLTNKILALDESI